MTDAPRSEQTAPREDSTLPTKAFRRAVLVPGFFVGAVLLLISMPIWVFVAAFASKFVPGRWRLLRVAWFLFVYLWWEIVALVALCGLWVQSGFGLWMRSKGSQARHWRFAAWWLDRVMGSARHTFNVTIERTNGPPPHDPAERPRRPLLVFCRHAGPGDSFLLIDELLNRFDRRPRIVLKDLLQFDPCLDILLNRVPSRFVPSTGRAGQATIDAIGELATGMESGDALVLFPEGGNFTSVRQERARTKLFQIGRTDLSERAGRMRHVLPPKPAGAMAAIAAAPEADVAFVGHVGLEQLSTLRDLWRGIPLDASVLTRVWRVPAGDVPPVDERESWLYDHWQVLDDWIDEQITARASSG